MWSDATVAASSCIGFGSGGSSRCGPAATAAVVVVAGFVVVGVVVAGVDEAGVVVGLVESPPDPLQAASTTSAVSARAPDHTARAPQAVRTGRDPRGRRPAVGRRGRGVGIDADAMRAGPRRRTRGRAELSSALGSVRFHEIVDTMSQDIVDTCSHGSGDQVPSPHSRCAATVIGRRGGCPVATVPRKSWDVAECLPLLAAEDCCALPPSRHGQPRKQPAEQEGAWPWWRAGRRTGRGSRRPRWLLRTDRLGRQPGGRDADLGTKDGPPSQRPAPLQAAVPERLARVAIRGGLTWAAVPVPTCASGASR